MAATTIAALITRVRAALDTRPFTSTATLTSGADTVATVTDGNDWEEGSIMEFWNNGGEQCLVQSVSGNDVTVVRGWNGTSAVTQTSQSVFRDPTFTYQQIERAITNAVADLWPHVWKTTNASIAPAPTTTVWYPLGDDCLGIVQAVQEYGANDEKLGFFGGGRDERQIVFEKNLNQTFVTNDAGVRFPNGFFHPTNNVLVKYAAAITGTVSDIRDDGELDVATAVVYGALAKLLTDKETHRVAVGEDVEVARSVRVGGRMQASGYYDRLFQREKEKLFVQCKRLFPIMPIKRVK